MEEFIFILLPRQTHEKNTRRSWGVIQEAGGATAFLVNEVDGWIKRTL